MAGTRGPTGRPQGPAPGGPNSPEPRGPATRPLTPRAWRASGPRSRRPVPSRSRRPLAATAAMTSECRRQVASLSPRSRCTRTPAERGFVHARRGTFRKWTVPPSGPCHGLRLPSRGDVVDVPSCRVRSAPVAQRPSAVQDAYADDLVRPRPPVAAALPPPVDHEVPGGSRQAQGPAGLTAFEMPRVSSSACRHRAKVLVRKWTPWHDRPRAAEARADHRMGAEDAERRHVDLGTGTHGRHSGRAVHGRESIPGSLPV